QSSGRPLKIVPAEIAAATRAQMDAERQQSACTWRRSNGYWIGNSRGGAAASEAPRTAARNARQQRLMHRHREVDQPAEVGQELIEVLVRWILAERAQHGLAKLVGDITLKVRAAARLLVDHLVPVLNRVLDHVVVVAVVNDVHRSHNGRSRFWLSRYRDG